MVDASVLTPAGNALLGLFLVVLAAFVARKSPDRAARGLLAAYLCLVGVNYLLDHGANVLGELDGEGDPTLDLRTTMRHGAILASIVDPALLLLFALAIAQRPRSRARVALIGAPVALVTLLYVATAPTGPFIIGWRFRALHAIVVGAYYALALWILSDRYLRATGSFQRDRLGAIVLAFGVAVLPRIVLLMVDLGYVNGPAIPAAKVALMLAGLAGLFAAALLLGRARVAAANRPHAVGTARSLGAALILVGALWSMLLLPALAGGAFAVLFSARWLVFCAILSGAVRRYDLLDVSDAAEGRIRAGFAVAVLVLAWGQVAGMLGQLPDSTAGAALLESGALVGAAAAVAYAFRRGPSMAGPEIGWRRLTVYRAHVELGAGAAELESVRERLGLSPRDAAEVRSLVELEREAPPAGAVLAEGARFVGRYEVQRFLGVGSFGRTFLAWDSVRRERVVLKELLREWRADPEALERFRREAETAVEVEHANLVAFRGLERAGDGHVLVLQFVEGESLRQRLRRGPVRPDEATTIARDVASGLAALHAAGIVHRDVKPDNVMIRPDGHAVLLDFGTVAVREEGTRPSGGRHPGTLAYMSPEAAAGGGVGPQSDIYSLGATLWEALTGAPAASVAPGPKAARLPPAWRTFLGRALEEDAAGRWPTADAFREAVPKAAAGRLKAGVGR